jgi:hypothetical protein
MRFGLRALVALPLVLGGCVTLTPTAVDTNALRQFEAPDAKLACPYRLRTLVDARPANSSMGVAQLKAFSMEDPIGIVRDQLANAGLRDTDDGRAIDVRLMQFYLSQNTITLVPVVVYEATPDGGAPMVIRGQPASQNSWGSDAEATEAFGDALRAANEKLIVSLNAQCPRTAGG